MAAMFRLRPLIHVVSLLLAVSCLSCVAHAAPANTSSSTPVGTGKTRVYFISVDVIRWRYSLSGKNMCQRRPFLYDELEALSGLNRKYQKAVFRQYTDRSFSTRVERSENWRHLGLLGPALHAEVDDTISIVLRNKAPFDVDFVVDNVAYVGGAANRKAVAPDNIGEYSFVATKDSAPAEESYSSSTMHFYRSTVGGPSHVYAGLLGPLIVTRKGEADAEGHPGGVENEIVTILWVGDEGASPLWTGRKVGDEAPHIHGINGFVYCSLESLHMQVGKRTRWYAGGVGNEVDIHSLHIHGNVATTPSGQHGDSFNILPYTSIALDFVPDNPGTWLVHCHISKHFKSVRGCSSVVLYTLRLFGFC
jgi:manganese oxidase